jgi:2'-5' RNA ligase
MRLFLAIELSDEVRRHLVRVRDAIKQELSANASFPREENFHITMKFLGEVEPQRAQSLVESMRLLRIGGAIELFASGIACFPDRGPVRIITAGFDGVRAGIESVHRQVEQRCQYLAFARETRSYQPHVTLARSRPTLSPSVRRSLVLDGYFPGPKLEVTELCLMESKLSAEGSEYRRLERFQLYPNIS